MSPSWRDKLAFAFAVESEGEAQFSEAEHQLVERLAQFVVRRRMTVVALMTLESSRPLNFVGSQALAFLAPLLTLIFNPSDVDRFIELLDRRSSIDLLCTTIVELENARNECRNE